MTEQHATSATHFDHPRLTVKERRLTLGRQYRVFTPDGDLKAYCKQKMFRLKEDIRFYTDETQENELFRLSTRKVIDFNANLDVVDSATGEVLGSLRRKGWRSLLRDKWEVYDASGQLVATAQEDNWFLALLRRFVLDLIPIGYTLTAPDERPVAHVRERFQLWGDTYDLEDHEPGNIDPRVLVGLVVCLDALEGE